MLSTTIIVPTFNEELYVTDSLSSLQNQSLVQAYPEQFQLMVVDSGSEDNTAEIASQMGWTVLPVALGKLTARDWAIKMASGDLIFAGDADTVYPPMHIETYQKHFLEDPNVVGVYGPLIIDGNPLFRFLSSIHLFQPTRFFGSNSMFRRDAYFKTGGFDMNVNQQDHQTMLYEEEDRFYESLSRIGKVVYDTSSPPLTSGRRQTLADKSWNKQREEGKRFETHQPFW